MAKRSALPIRKSCHDTLLAMQAISVHDNRILSYLVDSQCNRIVLHTQSERSELIDIIFDGVLAYLLEYDNFDNVLSTVEELPVDQVIASYRSLFQERSKYCWPGPWNTSIEACIDYLRLKRAKGYAINSSYGLSGWVIAVSYRLEAKRIG